MSAKKSNERRAPIAVWSASRRRIATALIAFHLAAVIFAPLSLGGAFESLFRPFQILRTYATVLYLDHGYRYFAPDPGPTHTIRFEHISADGAAHSEKLPDRKATRPRLLYHRWFMLGESLATEVAATLAGFDEFSRTQQDLQLEMAELRKLGRIREASQLQTIIDDNQREFDRHWARTLALSQALKKHIAGRFPGETIRIYSQRQLIPRPHDIWIDKPLVHPDFVEEIELTDPQATLNAAKTEEIAPPGVPAQ